MTTDTVEIFGLTVQEAYEAGVASVVPASVFDEPGFVAWAVREYKKSGIPSMIRPPRATDLLDGLLWSRHATYQTVAAVAAAYVAARDATKDGEEP